MPRGVGEGEGLFQWEAGLAGLSEFLEGISSVVCVVLKQVCGWYVVWQLFLSKFKFLRELIGDTGSQQGDNEPSEAEAEQETPPSPQRCRQKSARQRRAPTEDTT
ncbi:PREDICTED: small integral membrane protein 13 [Pygoscelis adeliae]|uniref:small integral membrane protein 13 n=1 Tax=Pygoscelis adeliae TaxID=9238 RepID=UPI0004F50B5E|nr:PREDICTED: small integral membrane protein 13 [Pygoscelis adeliae]